MGVSYPLHTLNEDDCVIDVLARRAGVIAVNYQSLMYYRKNSQSISRKGIPAEPWLRSVPYKQQRMAFLQQENKMAILYRVQRLFFYDLLLERAILFAEYIIAHPFHLVQSFQIPLAVPQNRARPA